jgi:hypothetical protein
MPKLRRRCPKSVETHQTIGVALFREVDRAVDVATQLKVVVEWL